MIAYVFKFWIIFDTLRMTQELRAMAQKAIELEVNNSKQVFYKAFVFSSLVLIKYKGSTISLL